MPKESKKEKKVKKSEGEVLRFQSPIAHPLADDKLTKKLFKIVKKGLQQDNFLKKKTKSQSCIYS